MTDSDNRVEPTVVDINLNGQEYALRAASTLADLVGNLGLPPQSISTAVNGEFITRDLRPKRVLIAGDCVYCFQAIVGG